MCGSGEEENHQNSINRKLRFIQKPPKAIPVSRLYI